MGSELPKQFLPIKGEPIMMRTIRAFYDYSEDISIIVVMNSQYSSHWNSLCRNYDFSIPHVVCDGGETRFHSVKNGLRHIIEKNSIIAIHDAVRPFITKEIIQN